MKTLHTVASLKLIDLERDDKVLRLEDDGLGALCDLTPEDASALGVAMIRGGLENGAPLAVPPNPPSVRSEAEIRNEIAARSLERSRTDELPRQLRLTHEIRALAWALGGLSEDLVWEKLHDVRNAKAIFAFHKEEQKLYRYEHADDGEASDWEVVEDPAEILRDRAKGILDRALEKIRTMGLHVLGTEGGETGGYTTNELDPSGRGYVILAKEEL